MMQEWVEDKDHQTIGGIRYVSRRTENTCNGGYTPGCELYHSGCSRFLCEYKRWYRADSPALAYFDNPKEEPKVTEKQPTTTVSATTLCETAADLMRERAKTYDVGGTMEG